MKSYSDLVIST